MDGADLGEQEICTRAPEIPLKLIEQVQEEHFLVCSSNQEIFYSINTILNSCDCLDFPQVWLCKHLAAVRHHFGIPDPEPLASLAWPCPIAPELLRTQEIGNAAHDTTCQNAACQENTTASVISAIDKIITLSWQLCDQAPRAMQDMVKSIHAVRSHLSVVATTATGDSQELPEKEVIAPNQLSWPETAQRMGVKHVEKCHGKVNSALTTELIGEPNCKWKGQDEDPYGAEEQSGKCPKPDARSTAANTQVQTAIESLPAPPAAPPASLPPRLPSAARPPVPPPAHTPHPTPAPCYLPMPPFSLLQPPLLPLSQPAPSSLNHYPPYYPYICKLGGRC